MPVKINNNFPKVMDEIEKKGARFVSAALSVAGVNSILLAPREYGTLANSQFQQTRIASGKITGTLGYAVDYAKYLNGLPGYAEPTWKPRPVGQKKGPSANLNAEPGFLEKGFESPQSRRAIQALAENIMKI